MSAGFSVKDAELIKMFLETKDPSQRITRIDLYNQFRQVIAARLTENQWLAELSKSFKDGKIAGWEVVKGRFGGIKKIDLTKIKVPPTQIKKQAIPVKKLQVALTPPEPKPVVVSKPVVKPTIPDNIKELAAELVKKKIPARLTIRDKKFELPESNAKIRALLIHVIEAKEDPEGFIVFNDKKYTCTDIQAEYLDKFLFWYFGAAWITHE